MKKLAAWSSWVFLVGAALAALSVTGCTQARSWWDGVMSQPIATQDSPAWYHFGAIMVPVLGHFIQFGITLLGSLWGVPAGP